jgi:4-hydroxybenzoate polyprenyltransferase
MESSTVSDSAVRNHRPAGIVKAAIKQLRLKQWTKNSFLFAALVFSGEFLTMEANIRAVIGFFAFCMMSSTGYVINDYLDREADRNHPKKKHRPIASGALPVPVAMLELAVIATVGFALAVWLSPSFLIIALIYLATTLSYSFYFKHVVILDVMFLATGFVWRALAGAIAIDVKISVWLFLCTAFLALFLGFSKRRAELLQLGANQGTRKNLQEYSAPMIEQIQSIVTANAVLSYALYTVLGANPWMTLTLPFVLYGIFRYIYLIEQKGEGGAPDETLLRDPPLILTVLLYTLTALGVIWAEKLAILPTLIQ